MDAIPYTVHGRLKFEYQGEVHIVLGDLDPYAFCNVAYFEEFIMTYLRYEIEPLEQSSLGKTHKKIDSYYRN